MKEGIRERKVENKRSEAREANDDNGSGVGVKVGVKAGVKVGVKVGGEQDEQQSRVRKNSQSEAKEQNWGGTGHWHNNEVTRGTSGSWKIRLKKSQREGARQLSTQPSRCMDEKDVVVLRVESRDGDDKQGAWGRRSRTLIKFDGTEESQLLRACTSGHGCAVATQPKYQPVPQCYPQS
ncbi:uncharacterized protein MONBRDRAFT_11021 [Monosiga brevicollis MX1]|uniref:Uncharacterized protein n=1 Tax=Monosiga brevicollis TaxID=81824 RepID=A9V7Z3_MONBE|nr:uncharacterized protein MONBRDRAFT_11021 [Monosiga brevicollis MX1]EDQ86391.1 predicted protein [Monosiga brevicollis MX1]|eukprot:XP_001748781.1 hypothetical protein [Monosiga brevicollis MX1]